jgi:hypothetical protein
MIRLFLYAAVFFSSVVFWEPAPYEFFCILALFFALFRFDQIKAFITENPWPFRIFCFFIGSNFISFLFNSRDRVSFDYLAVTTYLAFTVLLVIFFLDRDDVRKIFWISSIGLLVTSVIALAAYFDLVYHTIVPTGSYRLKAFFKDPNVYAAFIVPHLFFLCHELRGSSLKKNIFIIGLMGIFTTCFFLTYSRGGLINLLGGGCAFLFYLFFAGRLSAPWLRRRIFVAAAGLLICFLLILQTNTFFAEKFISRLQVVDHSNLGRLSVQIKGFDIWAGTDLGDGLSFVERFEDEVLGGETGARGLAPVPANPLARWAFGIGPGRWEEVIPFSAHGLYARALVEQGLIGLGVLLFVLFTVLRGLCKKKDDPLALVLFCSIAGIMVQSLVIDTVHWRHFYLLVGLALKVR